MPERGNPVKLSKSKFIAGLQCLKRLYWSVHEPERAAKPDEAAQAVLDQGQEVGKVAQTGFHGGVAVEAEYWDVGNALKRTAELMADPKVPAIFEGTFSAENILVRADILQRTRGNQWKLIEVKSTTRVKEEEYHVEDVGIQKYVLERAGVELSSANLMHLNRGYIYNGVRLVPEELFTVVNVKRELEQIERSLPALLKMQWEILAKPEPPDVEPAKQCCSPYQCEFYDQCNEEMPEDYVGRLPRIGDRKIDQLKEMEITSIKDIPAAFPLSPKQRRICECVKAGTLFFDSALRRDLSELKYPLWFMDFETFYPAIPRFSGMRPFDHIPFQWSVHVQHESGGQLKHRDFLSDDGRDPRPQFVRSLLEVLESGTKCGKIVVYNQSFESARLAELASWLPQYAERISRVRSRLWDLLAVVRSHVYHLAFGGSFSMKEVLPALVPSMSYAGMEVSEGNEAGLAYDALVRGALNDQERSKLRKALLSYCKQDSLGMVRLLERLQKE